MDADADKAAHAVAEHAARLDALVRRGAPISPTMCCAPLMIVMPITQVQICASIQRLARGAFCQPGAGA